MTKSTKTKNVIKAPVAPKKKVFYAVNYRNTDTIAEDEIWLYGSLQEAYTAHLDDSSPEEKCYAYKIEFMGEVSMELKIKP